MKKENPQHIPKEELIRQLKLIANGTQFINLKRTCTLDAGIEAFSKNDLAVYIRKYEETLVSGKTVTKFVPASGAASRMFKHLYTVDNLAENKELILSFFGGLKHFPFYEELEGVLNANGLNLSKLLDEKSYHVIADSILSKNGLGYGDIPKGMVKFHKYKSEVRTAFEEQLMEGLNYCKNKQSEIDIHFTVAQKYADKIRNHIQSAVKKLEKEHAVNFIISYSFQASSTDTIAVDLKNNPLRNNGNELILRPGGHGSLLKNLNDLDSDIIFIKNIDNVSIKNNNGDNNLYKKAIGGKLVELQDFVFYALRKLSTGQIELTDLIKIQEYVGSMFHNILPKNFDLFNQQEKITYFIKLLDRPIRVCGMVKNEGAPGGGPFIVESYNNESLQIVESSQVDFEDKQQVRIWNSSSHFNPVDIVCSIKNFKGEKFNLQKFVDPNTAFISKKSNNGEILKALEWPGLWNGSMANWLTVFVEVPSHTFTPVKTINDLLKPAHQNKEQLVLKSV